MLGENISLDIWNISFEMNTENFQSETVHPLTFCDAVSDYRALN